MSGLDLLGSLITPEICSIVPDIRFKDHELKFLSRRGVPNMSGFIQGKAAEGSLSSSLEELSTKCGPIQNVFPEVSVELFIAETEGKQLS